MESSISKGDILKDRFLIEAEMRPGGFGKVFLAVDTQLHNRRVVIKTMEGDQVSIDISWAKLHFADEIKALVRVKHPGVIGILDVGETTTHVPYLIMPFVEGKNLRTVMLEGRLNLFRVGRIIDQLSLAVSAAHQEGITHRDIKPENILLQSFKSGQENVVLIDFGISTLRDLQRNDPIKLTRVAGTWPYMAPEQLDGLPDFASDTWALGVLAFELVTGEVPFQATGEKELARQQLAGPFKMPRDLRPDVPLAAEEVILKALSINPADRYNGIHEMGAAFLRAVTETEIGASHFNPVPEPPRSEAASESFEGHVLLVGLAEQPGSTREQKKALTALHEYVLEAPTIQRHSEVVSTQLEDAIALVFADFLNAVHCAIEIASVGRAQTGGEVRIGMHSGPVQRASGPNGATFKGSGLAGAMAVMSCADGGHILLSQSTADRLVGPERKWLQDLGEHEITQDLFLHLYNLWTGKVGSPRWPRKLPKQPLNQQPTLSELLEQCQQLFKSLDEFLTPGNLRIVFRSIKLSNYAECVPRSTDLDLELFLDCLHRKGRNYKGEALVDLLDQLAIKYQADYQATELEALKRDLTSVLTHRS